jgi:TetR/AcrR family transcriptional repressor of nem operon
MSKGEVTRERIIAAAAPLFNQRGYAGCSISDVLEATGLEKGCLYRHFSSKEELAAEAFSYALKQAVKLRTDDLEHVHGAEAKLKYLIDRFVDLPSPVPGGCPILNTAIDSDDGNPELRALVRRAIRDWKTRLAKIIEDGCRAGELHPETDPAGTANTIVALLEGSLMISRIEGKRDALEDARKTLHRLIATLA